MWLSTPMRSGIGERASSLIMFYVPRLRIGANLVSSIFVVVLLLLNNKNTCFFAVNVSTLFFFCCCCFVFSTVCSLFELL